MGRSHGCGVGYLVIRKRYAGDEEVDGCSGGAEDD